MKMLMTLLCLALAACLNVGKRAGQPAVAVYDLGTPVERQPGDGQTVPLGLEVRSPHWLDSLGIEYRLAYAEPGRLRDYAQARWAAAPAMLIQQRLVQQLGLVSAGVGGASCVLRIDMDEFSQIFDTPQSSHGALRARAVILDAGRNPLADESFRIDRPAASQDSRGGVAALAAAVDELARGLDKWRDKLAAGGQLKPCVR